MRRGRKNAIKQFGDSLLNLASPFDQRDAAAPKLLNSSVDKLDECKIHTRRQLRCKMRIVIDFFLDSSSLGRIIS
jgi:hypothetical protein